MFSKDGFVTPATIRRILYAYAARRGTVLEQMSRRERLEYGAREFWAFAANADRVYLMNECGDIISGRAPEFLTPDNPSRTYNYYFSIQEGILGKPRYLRLDGLRPGNTVLRFVVDFLLLPLRFGLAAGEYTQQKASLGRFYGLAVVFSYDQLNKYLDNLLGEGGEQIEATGAQGLNEKDAARNIIEWFDAGAVRSKAEARELIGEKLSVRGFGRAWERASSERPELSKAGRRRLLE